MSDQYEKAVAYLTKNPREIWDAWQFCSTHEGGVLFQRFPDATGTWPPEFQTLNTEARKRVMGEDFMPTQGGDIRVQHLAMIADWNRRLDAELTV